MIAQKFRDQEGSGKRRITVHLIPMALGLLGIATVGLLTVWADRFGVTEESSTKVSRTSPFDDSCGIFPGTPAGALFFDSEVEPWIDVNPLNPDNIVAFWQQDRWSNGGARGNVAGVSFDGGLSWETVVVPGLTLCSGGEFERASDPWLSFGPDGTLYQISLVFDFNPPPGAPGGFGRSGLAVSKSRDGGLTWSDPTLLSLNEAPRFLIDKQSLTADPTDANFVYAVWDRLQLSVGSVINPGNVFNRTFETIRGFKSPFYFARSTDGGETWEPARMIYDPGANMQTNGHQIVVLPNGKIINIFLVIDNSDPSASKYNLFLLYSDNKGQTWEPIDQGDPPIWIAEMRRRRVITPDSGIPVRSSDFNPEVAVDPNNGNLYVLWQDARFNDVTGTAFSMSTGGSLSWTVPVKINKTPPNGNKWREQAFMPSVAVTSEGIVGVTYYDFRNDNELGEQVDYWFIHCHPVPIDTNWDNIPEIPAVDCSDPNNWGDEVRITEEFFDISFAPYAGGYFLGDYVGLAADNTDFLAFFPQSFENDPANGYFRRVKPLLE